MKLKKLLASFSAIALALTSMSVGALADSTVAKVGDDEYTTFEGAVAAATEGQTITLTEDVALTENFNIENVNVNLNGHVLTLFKSVSDNENITNGTVKIYNGTIKVPDGTKDSEFVLNSGYAKGNADVTYENVKVIGENVVTNSIFRADNSKITLKHVYIEFTSIGNGSAGYICYGASGAGTYDTFIIDDLTVKAGCYKVFQDVDNLNANDIRVSGSLEKDIFSNTAGIISNSTIDVTTARSLISSTSGITFINTTIKAPLTYVKYKDYNANYTNYADDKSTLNSESIIDNEHILPLDDTKSSTISDDSDAADAIANAATADKTIILNTDVENVDLSSVSDSFALITNSNKLTLASGVLKVDGAKYQYAENAKSDGTYVELNGTTYNQMDVKTFTTTPKTAVITATKGTTTANKTVDLVDMPQLDGASLLLNYIITEIPDGTSVSVSLQ